MVTALRGKVQGHPQASRLPSASDALCKASRRPRSPGLIWEAGMVAPPRTITTTMASFKQEGKPTPAAGDPGTGPSPPHRSRASASIAPTTSASVL
jgi:hypothetical protein